MNESLIIKNTQTYTTKLKKRLKMNIKKKRMKMKYSTSIIS